MSTLRPAAALRGAFLALLLGGAVLVAAAWESGVPEDPGAMPAVVVWAWERPEDLSFLDPRKVGVAALVVTVTLQGEEILVEPRRSPLRLPAGVRRLAVMRVEVAPGRPPGLGAEQLRALVDIALASMSSEDLGLQVDFDATVSQQPFYLSLLAALRGALPANRRLSVAGLASWCQPGSWLESAPVDEMVPMLYRMGPDGGAIRRRLARGEPLPGTVCRSAVGISSDEPPPRVPPAERLYLFHPEPWSVAAFQELTAVGGKAPRPWSLP